MQVCSLPPAASWHRPAPQPTRRRLVGPPTAGPTRVSGRKPLPQPRRADQHVRGHMKAITNLTNHGHAELSFTVHDLNDPTVALITPSPHRSDHIATQNRKII